MHPITANPWRLGAYQAIWLVIGAGLAGVLRLLLPVTYADALQFTLPLAVVYGMVCLSAWWVCQALPLGETELVRLVTSLAMAIGLSSLAWGALAAVWAALLRRWGVMPENRVVSFEAIGIVLAAGVPLYVLSLALHYLLLTFEVARAAERRAFESQVTAREAELRALRAQLNPHFLFNSLNSINALVGSQPEAARRMCENLGDFMRKTLALGAREAVTLDDELALVDRYLDIERVRFGERCKVTRDIASDTRACRVPPLLLQPLVENAIKHGVAARVEGGTVHLAARRTGGTLHLVVENDVDEDIATRPGEGVGLENVRRRLRALAGRDARLETERRDGLFRVTLALPARDDADEAAGAGHDAGGPPSMTVPGVSSGGGGS
ncbi:MAG: sensor histidine kinase [Candidatus Eisenbacteria bacterium]